MNITEFRQQYPQYDGVDDEKLSKSLHQKYYADVPYDDFKSQFNPRSDDKNWLEKGIDAATSREAFQMYGGAAGGLVGSGVAPVAGTAVGAGLGAGAGGQLHDLLFGEASSGAEQAEKAVKDIAIEGATALVAPKAAQLAVDAVQRGLTPLAKSTARALTGTKGVGANTIDDIRMMKEEGLVADASLLDNPTLQQMGQELRAKPVSNTIMQKTDRANWEKFQEMAEKTAQKLGSAESAEAAGETLKTAAKKNKKKFFDVANRLYGEVDGFLPDAIPATKTFSYAKQALDEAFDEAEMKAINKILAKFSDDGAINKKGLQELRRMANKAHSKSVKSDADLMIIEMRKQLGEDLDDVVSVVGGEQGSKALKAANSWWKKGVGKKSGKPGSLQTYDEILKKEEAADTISGALQNIGKKRAGSKKLIRYMKDNPEAADDLRAVAFRELGGVGDSFSYQKFLSGYDKMNPKAREILFGIADKDIKKVKRVAEIASSLEKRANFSNTENSRVFNQLWEPIKRGMLLGGVGGGTTMDLGTALGGATLGAGVVGTGMGFNALRAKAFTNPKFVNWLADTSERVLIKPDKLPAQMTRLAMIATGMSEDVGDVLFDYIQKQGFNLTKRFDKDGNLKSVEVK